VSDIARDSRQNPAALCALGDDALAVGALRLLDLRQARRFLARSGAHLRQFGQPGAERVDHRRHRARHVPQVIQLARHLGRVFARQDQPQSVGCAAFSPRFEHAPEGVLLRGEILL
jgi:hypothetical protein